MNKINKKKNIKILTNKDEKNKNSKKNPLEIKKLLELNKRYLNNWKKTEADFSNYKKEDGIRIKENIEYQQQKIILDFLDISDNISLAKNYIPNDLKKNKWVLGVMQIKEQMNKLLKNYNVEKIKTLGIMVDFKFHEVLQEVETKKEKSGIITDEVQKGYTMNNKVIRAAKVIIAK